MRIVFPHIPKCCGSSIAAQLRSMTNVHLDYSLHPTWISATDISSGILERAKMIEKLDRLENWIVFGHFHSNAFDALAHDLKIILLRPPLERAISHYHYLKQVLDDNIITRRRHGEVGAIKDGHMTFEQFARLDHIRSFYGQFYLKNLEDNTKTLGLSTDNIDNAFTMIQEYAGIKLDKNVWINKSHHQEKFESCAPYFSDDDNLYQNIITRRPALSS